MMPDFTPYDAYIYAAYGLTLGGLVATALIVVIQWLRARRLGV